jgi:hypothetical protein
MQRAQAACTGSTRTCPIMSPLAERRGSSTMPLHLPYEMLPPGYRRQHDSVHGERVCSVHRQRAQAAPARAPRCHPERSEGAPPRCPCTSPMRCFRRVTGVSMTAWMESVHAACPCSVPLQHPHVPHDVTLSGAKGLLHDETAPPMRCFRRVTGVSMTACMESERWLTRRGHDLHESVHGSVRCSAHLQRVHAAPARSTHSLPEDVHSGKRNATVLGR